jgi:V/A-type H+/Na+-transporting ATPase subunit F
MKYAIIGDEDTVLGFGIVGVSGQIAATAEEAKLSFQATLEDSTVGIIIITEAVADMIRSTVDRYLFTESFPLIVEIPDRKGRQADRPNIKDMVNAAIGIKI